MQVMFAYFPQCILDKAATAQHMTTAQNITSETGRNVSTSEVNKPSTAQIGYFK